jgi:hypothetical protein
LRRSSDADFALRARLRPDRQFANKKTTELGACARSISGWYSLPRALFDALAGPLNDHGILTEQAAAIKVFSLFNYRFYIGGLLD